MNSTQSHVNLSQVNTNTNFYMNDNNQSSQKDFFHAEPNVYDPSKLCLDMPISIENKNYIKVKI